MFDISKFNCVGFQNVNFIVNFCLYGIEQNNVDERDVIINTMSCHYYLLLRVSTVHLSVQMAG